MKIYILLFIYSLLLGLFFTPLVRAFGIRFKILDRPSLRKIHQGEIPRLGGVAIFLAAIIPFSLALFLLFPESAFDPENRGKLLGLALGTLIVFGVGIWDDLFRLSPTPKLIAEGCAALVAFLFGLQIDLVTNPFGFQWNLAWLSGPVTVLWLVSVTNAINLADGVDGLAAGIVTFATIILFFMTFNTLHTMVAFLSVALAGATLGFLRHNFYPATIFLGDSGSLFLGFCLGGLSLWASEKSTITFALLIPMVTLGLPLADMIYAVLRRWSRGIPIKEADRDHIHHKLLEMGFSQRPTVLLLYGVNIFLATLAGLLLVTRNSLAAYIVVFLGVALIVFSRLLGYFRFSRILISLRQGIQISQQGRYIRFRTRQVALAFEEEISLPGRWKLMEELFVDMSFSQVEFSPQIPSLPSLSWEAAEWPQDRPQEELTLHLFLKKGKQPFGFIKFQWARGGNNIPPGMNRLISLMANEFCHGFSEKTV